MYYDPECAWNKPKLILSSNRWRQTEWWNRWGPLKPESFAFKEWMDQSFTALSSIREEGLANLDVNPPVDHFQLLVHYCVRKKEMNRDNEKEINSGTNRWIHIGVFCVSFSCLSDHKPSEPVRYESEYKYHTDKLQTREQSQSFLVQQT